MMLDRNYPKALQDKMAKSRAEAAEANKKNPKSRQVLRVEVRDLAMRNAAVAFPNEKRRVRRRFAKLVFPVLWARRGV